MNKEKVDLIVKEIFDNFGLYDDIYDGYKANGKYISMPIEVDYEMHEKGIKIYDVISDTISDIESDGTTKVYYVIVENDFINFLCVTDEDISHEFYKTSLKFNLVFAYVKNLKNPDFSEYGDITVRNELGEFERVWR